MGGCGQRGHLGWGGCTCLTCIMVGSVGSFGGEWKGGRRKGREMYIDHDEGVDFGILLLVEAAVG